VQIKGKNSLPLNPFLFAFYLKRINIDYLIKVYMERVELIKNLKENTKLDDIVYEDCINTKIQTELMFCNSS
jgi:hypothetical protein